MDEEKLPGEILRKFREGRGLSQEELARATDPVHWDASKVRNWERYDPRRPKGGGARFRWDDLKQFGDSWGKQVEKDARLIDPVRQTYEALEKAVEYQYRLIREIREQRRKERERAQAGGARNTKGRSTCVCRPVVWLRYRASTRSY